VEQVKWRDGSEHTAQYAWFRHQPAGCESPQRFAVVRHRPTGEMFWRYAFLTANEREGSAQLAFERHRLKGDKERVLSELLSDLDLHHPPCTNLNANRSFYTLAVLAWNLLQALKLLHLPERESPKRMRTLLRHLLLIPVELKRHARGLKGVPVCAGRLGGVVARIAEGTAAALSGAESRSGERVWLKKRSANPFFRKGAGREKPPRTKGCALKPPCRGRRAAKKAAAETSLEKPSSHQGA
jgi:hypothetical protein